MKKIGSVLIVVLLFSCTGSDKLLQQKPGDDDIDALIAWLTKHPADKGTIARLDFLMIRQQGQEQAEIEKLKLSGRPEIWEDVLQRYQKLDMQQRKLSLLPDTTRALMQFAPEAYTPFIEQARTKAAEYNYVSALKLIESNRYEDHQKAYYLLRKVNDLIDNYKDVDELLGNFNRIIPYQVYYEVKNVFQGYIPPMLNDELMYVDLSPFNSVMVQFHQNAKMAEHADFIVTIEITDIKIQPENTTDNYFVETAKVQDGIGYKLDENGNFLYDSLGQKIEFPLLKTIACYVSEKVKEKSLFIAGRVEIRNRTDNTVTAWKNISGETHFINRSAVFKGDINALSPETYQLIGSREQDYPGDLEMILRASDKFKQNAAGFIIDEMSKLKPILTKIE